MKKYLTIALVPLALCATEGKYNGYSYFGFGNQNIKYVEKLTLSTGEQVESLAEANSPVYTSGTLVRVNDTYDFSIDLASTLLPTQIGETWTVDGALAQQNQFDAMLNSMQFLGHYKLSENHRIVAGTAYTLNSYKRYNFKDETGAYLLDPDTNAKYGLLEERIATLYLTGGYWFESAPLATPNTPRFRFNALYNQPVWNDATNTEFEAVSFNSTSGYKVEMNAYAGYPILKGLELGTFGGYSIQKKSGTDVASDGRTKWPDNTLTQWQMGLSLVWNFSGK